MVAIGCGVAAALLGTAALIYIGRQIFKGRSMVNYEFLHNHHTEVEDASTSSVIDMDEVEDRHERHHIKGPSSDRKHNKQQHHYRHHRKYP